MSLTLGRACQGALLVTALIGCSTSPPVHYYTLLAPEVGVKSAASRERGAAALYLLEVMPVTVPPQVDQPQIMIRESNGAVLAYYSDRWTAPLADEIRSALSYNLVRQLDVLDVRAITALASAPVWRVHVDVQRFEAVVNGAVVLDATWQIRPVNVPGATLLCRSVVEIPLASGSPAQAVLAQQQATADLASTIASGIRSGGVQAQPGSQAVQLSTCRSS